MLNIMATLILLILTVGGCLLEYGLSRMKSRWPGLVLPALCFLYSLVLVFSLAPGAGASVWDVLWLILLVLLRGNVPTLVLLLIYGLARRKDTRKKELEKMDLQDL